MAKAITRIVMSSGNVIPTEDAPDDVIAKFTDNNGKLKNAFIEFGITYINPSQVSELIYGEKEYEFTKEEQRAEEELRKLL
jgi:hypothetical protein